MTELHAGQLQRAGRPAALGAGAAVHPVTLRYSDGVEREIVVAAGETVLDAALADGAAVLHQCRSGSCTSCAARLVEGDAAMTAGRSSSLLVSEQAEGMRLLCLTQPTSSCTFEVGYASDIGAAGPVAGHAFINAIDQLAPDVVRLRLELADEFWMDFKPGQFLQVRVPGAEQTRSYSFASSPAKLPEFELLIRLLPSGAMSDYLRNHARVDDALEIEGPFGAFFLREKVRAPHIMIAGGTGLAPMMSMIDELRMGSGRRPPLLLSFGCATAEGLFHLDEIELRKMWMPSLEVRVSVERGQAGEGVRTGNPVSAIEARDVPGPDAVAYLCGPPAMVAAAHERLRELGLAPENIHAEQFVASR